MGGKPGDIEHWKFWLRFCTCNYTQNKSGCVADLCWQPKSGHRRKPWSISTIVFISFNLIISEKNEHQCIACDDGISRLDDTASGHRPVWNAFAVLLCGKCIIWGGDFNISCGKINILIGYFNMWYGYFNIWLSYVNIRCDDVNI